VRRRVTRILAASFVTSLRMSPPGHTFPFIAWRQTRACLNLEVKDGAPISSVAEIGIYDVEIGRVRLRMMARLWRVLAFKARVRPSADHGL
jgi:hypothetical protein